ncbi:MAG: hypothetical protein ABEK59_01440 [Halobacteria archaeon]
MRILFAALLVMSQPMFVDGYCQKQGTIGEIDVMMCDSEYDWRGYARYGGEAIWLNEATNISPYLVIHEIGHTQGKRHWQGGAMSLDAFKHPTELHHITKEIARNNEDLHLLEMDNVSDAKWLLERRQPLLYPSQEEMIYIESSLPTRRLYGVSAAYSKAINDTAR